MPSDPEVVIGRIASTLDSLGIGYLIGGSVASSIHGVPRMTHDIDLVADLALEDVDALVARLQGEFYLDAAAVREAVESRGTFNVIHLATILKVDVFIRQKTAWADEEWARRKLVSMGSASDSPAAYIASAEDIVLQKLEWYRLGGGVSERQWGDVIGTLKVQAAELDHAYLRKWAATLNLDALLDRALADAGCSRPSAEP